MLNKVQLIGHLGADPEIRHTQDGRPIASMRLATSESWRDKNTGERKEITDWHTIVVFNEGLCKVVEQYLKKGSKVYVEGQLKTRKWQDRDGNDRYSTEVVLQNFGSTLVMLDSKPSNRPSPPGSEEDYGVPRTRESGDDDSGRSAPMQRPQAGGYDAPQSSSQFTRDDLDDEVPF